MLNTVFNQELALELYQSSEKFPVGFDWAWQVLEFSRKDSAKRNFDKAGFVEGIDFEVFHIREENLLGGRPREEIKLSVECFKQWGMMAGTEKGKQIRLYFLECEKLAKKALLNQPKTPAEMMLYYAQQLVEQERRLFQLESSKFEQDDRITAIEAEQERYNYPSGHKFTVMGFANLHGLKISATLAANKGKKASLICKNRDIPIERIHDPRFGRVGMYPEEILVEVFRE